MYCGVTAAEPSLDEGLGDVWTRDGRIQNLPGFVVLMLQRRPTAGKNSFGNSFCDALGSRSSALEGDLFCFRISGHLDRRTPSVGLVPSGN